MAQRAERSIIGTTKECCAVHKHTTTINKRNDQKLRFVSVTASRKSRARKRSQDSPVICEEKSEDLLASDPGSGSQRLQKSTFEVSTINSSNSSNKNCSISNTRTSSNNNYSITSSSSSISNGSNSSSSIKSSGSNSSSITSSSSINSSGSNSSSITSSRSINSSGSNSSSITSSGSNRSSSINSSGSNSSSSSTCSSSINSSGSNSSSSINSSGINSSSITSSNNTNSSGINSSSITSSNNTNSSDSNTHTISDANKAEAGSIRTARQYERIHQREPSEGTEQAVFVLAPAYRARSCTDNHGLTTKRSLAHTMQMSVNKPKRFALAISWPEMVYSRAIEYRRSEENSTITKSIKSGGLVDR
ncbi:hypothetical protein FHG87_006356 [Trinorchestia longiramus]|nr:hypothetical protein FHG87_006356 [Trinorchestia longiramus]